MTGSTAAAVNRALGRVRRALAARHLVEQGMVLLDRNWRCDAGEIDLVLRDGRRAGGVRGEDPQQRRLAAPRTRRSPDASSTGWAGSARGGSRRTASPPRSSGSTWSCVLRARRGPSTVEHVRGVLLMPLRHRPHDLPAGRSRPPDRRPGRRLAGPGRHHPGRPARRLAPRGPRPVPDGDRTTARLDVAGDQADHDPAVAGRPAQARHPLRPGDRGGGARGRRTVPRRARSTAPSSSASSPSPAGCARCPACCRW